MKRYKKFNKVLEQLKGINNNNSNINNNYNNYRIAKSGNYKDNFVKVEILNSDYKMVDSYVIKWDKLKNDYIVNKC